MTFCADHVQLSREAPHEKIRTLHTLFFMIVSISSERSVYVVCALFSWPGKKNKLLLIGTNSTLRPRPFRTLKRGVPASSIEKNDPFLKKPFPQSKGFRSGRLWSFLIILFRALFFQVPKFCAEILTLFFSKRRGKFRKMVIFSCFLTIFCQI